MVDEASARTSRTQTITQKEEKTPDHTLTGVQNTKRNTTIREKVTKGGEKLQLHG